MAAEWSIILAWDELGERNRAAAASHTTYAETNSSLRQALQLPDILGINKKQNKWHPRVLHLKLWE